jgi:hypothetical protein
MRVVDVKMDMYVATKFNGEWHRGQVFEISGAKCSVSYLFHLLIFLH